MENSVQARFFLRPNGFYVNTQPPLPVLWLEVPPEAISQQSNLGTSGKVQDGKAERISETCYKVWKDKHPHLLDAKSDFLLKNPTLHTFTTTLISLVVMVYTYA